MFECLRYDHAQISRHAWLSEGAIPVDTDLDLSKLGKFNGWRRGFQGTVFAMMGIKRWKEIALKKYPPKEDGKSFVEQIWRLCFF